MPDLDHMPALMLAYHAADTGGDGWIGRQEFGEMLAYLSYFVSCWSA